MRKAVVPLLGLAGLIFMTAPILIARARYESTMGLVQKIFYFHMPPAMLMLLSAIFCGIVSGIFLVRKRPFYDWMAFAAAELTVLYGAMAMVTGPLWARKAWGVWWVWDARLTMSLLHVDGLRLLSAPSALRRAGIRNAGGGTRALRHGDRAVCLSVGQHLADDSPADVGRPDAPGRFRACAVVFVRWLSADVHRADDVAHETSSGSARCWTSFISRARNEKNLSHRLAADERGGLRAAWSIRFQPVTEIPASEQLPSAPLVIVAYAFVWLAFMVYVWMMWRKLGKVEQELNHLSTQIGKKRAMNFANMTSAHFIFIPVVLFVGIVIGWILGSRAAQDAYAMEMKKRQTTRGTVDIALGSRAMKTFWHPLALCAFMAGAAFGLERLDPFPEDRIQVQPSPATLPSTRIIPASAVAEGTPLLSLVIARNALHDPASGILTHFDERGREWERPGYISSLRRGTPEARDEDGGAPSWRRQPSVLQGEELPVLFQIRVMARPPSRHRYSSRQGRRAISRG